MIAVMRSEFYRLCTVRSWWLSLIGAGLLTTAVGVLGDGPWAALVGMATFGFGVVAGTQHYQHRTAVLLFLARPRRLSVLFGQIVTYVAAATAFAAVTGVPVLFSQPAAYLTTIMATPFLAVFAASNAVILRRPIWILAGWGGWFVAVEVLAGRLILPGPFAGFLRGGSQSSLTYFAVLVVWAVASAIVAGWAVRRDLAGD